MTTPEELADDLALAQACIHGDSHAQRRFVARFGATIDGVLGRWRVPEADRADVRQALLERVLVDGDDRPAKLRSYRGAAPLGAWLRVCVMREVLTLARRRRAAIEVPMRLGEPGTRETPETHLVVHERRQRFELAFEAALRELEPRERNLLRHRVLHRLDQEQIAALYGVHRVTVARWFMRMRDKLRDTTRRVVEHTDVIGSGIDVQLGHLLGRHAELEPVA